MSNYNPRNRNMPTHEAPKSTARWFDDRKSETATPCGFEPWRWEVSNTHGKGDR